MIMQNSDNFQNNYLRCKTIISQPYGNGKIKPSCQNLENLSFVVQFMFNRAGVLLAVTQKTNQFFIASHSKVFQSSF